MDREKNALERHEFYNGEVLAIAGNTPAHSSIATNVIASLVNQLADSDCNVRDSNMALREKHFFRVLLYRVKET